MTIKNGWVNRTTFDNVVKEVSELQSEKSKENRAHWAARELASKELQEVRGESFKRQNWVVWLAITASVEALTIWALVLVFVLGNH